MVPNTIHDDYIKDYYNINPTINDFFLKDEWTNRKGEQPNIYSEEYYRRMNNLNKKYVKILKKKKNLSVYEKILKRDIEHSIHMEEGYMIYYYMPINISSNLLIHYVSECSGDGYYHFRTKKDYVYFLSRLKSLNGVTDEIIKKMKDGIKNGITLYKKTTEQMIDNIHGILKNKPYRHNKDILISKKLWNESVESYLVDNLTKLNQFLINDYFENSSDKFGLHSYKGGKRAYRYMLEMNTLKGATPEKIFQLGLLELKRLKKKKLKLEKKMNKGDIDKYIENKKNYYTEKKDIIDDLYEIQDDLIKNVYGPNFHGEIRKKDHYKIKSIRLERKNHFAYYLSSDLKNINKGTFYINTFNPELINKYELYVLSLHEGIPGHHYEINYHNNSDIPDYFKIVGYNSYSEGWGLYCEGLGDYTDDRELYFKIKYGILRSLRLVIDTGIHYFRWDFKKCFQLMKEYLNYSEEGIHRSLLRYIDNPCQALTYKVGERTIIYLRNEYLKKGGSIKDFHKIIMELGPCPLDTLIDYFYR